MQHGTLLSVYHHHARDIVSKTVDIFLSVIPLHCNFNGNAVFALGKMKWLFVDRGFTLIQVLNKRLNTFMLK